MANPKTTVLPPLAFGHLRSKVDLDLLQMQQRVSSITNWTSEYDVLDKVASFQHRTAVFATNDVRLIAVASTPTVMKVSSPDCTIAIPLHGSLQAWVGNRQFKVESSSHALYFPEGKRHAEGGVKSTLLISISRQRLLESARVMLGGQRLLDVDFDTPRILSTRHGTIDFLRMLEQLCGLIDQFGGHLELLNNFSPDETIVRVVVMMLAPELFFPEESDRRKNGKARVDVINFLCEFVAANSDQPINLTTLESVSGLSARVLQQEFKKRYACSPLQWVREQRLDHARQMLQIPSVITTVSMVAAQCGFDNLSDFAKRYLQRFKELPSETLRKSRSAN
jgi:AraC-like DNA-binding protein